MRFAVLSLSGRQGLGYHSGISQFLVTVIFAIYAAGVIVALLLFGNASDRIGRRRALLPGLILSALSAVAFLAAQGIGLMLVGRVLSGFSAGIFTGTATVAVVELAEPERRNQATLLATVANIGGLGMGPLLAGLLVEYAPAPLHLSFIVPAGPPDLSFFMLSRVSALGNYCCEVPVGQDETVFVFAAKAVKLLYDYKHGKMPPSPIIDSGVDVVTRENVDDYAAKWKKMENGS